MIFPEDAKVHSCSRKILSYNGYDDKYLIYPGIYISCKFFEGILLFKFELLQSHLPNSKDD